MAAAVALGIPAPIAQAQWLSEPNLIHLARSGGWQTYHSQRGGFSTELPGSANWETEETEFKGYPLTVHVLEVESDSNAYGIGYADLPKAYLAKGSEKVLDEVGRELLSQRMKPIPGEELNPSLRNYPGRFTQQGLFHMTMKARLHLVNERMYFVFAASDQETAVDRFLNAFSLL